MTKEFKKEVIQRFHLPNHFSIKSVNGPFIPEISAVVSIWLLIPVQVGTVLFYIYVPHETPIIMQTPPFSANIKSNASHFS
jgi:hypothetical protein